jgi:hypothetical protein
VQAYLLALAPVSQLANRKGIAELGPLNVTVPTKLNFVHISGKAFSTLAPADYAFWGYLNQVVQEGPTESLDPVTLDLYVSVGIQNGKPLAPDARMKKILTEAATVGDAGTGGAVAAAKVVAQRQPELIALMQGLTAGAMGR